jgi:hypothetical protein
MKFPPVRLIATLCLGLTMAGTVYALEPRSEAGSVPERAQPGPRPDLSVELTLLDDRPPKAVTVYNKGKAAAGPSTLMFYCEPMYSQSARCPFYGRTQPLTRAIPPLAPGARHEVLILDAHHPWTPKDWSCGTYKFTAIADAHQQIPESSERNNRGEIGVQVGCGHWSGKKISITTNPIPPPASRPHACNRAAC